MQRSGNPDEDFFYLGGPMTGIPQFNFPRFREVANKMRAQNYNIISPAELDDPDTEAAALASPDGAPGSGSANGESYEDFLGRDLIICSLPTCVGMICMDGWHNSRGARGESWVVAYLKKQLLEYDDSSGSVVLTAIDRDERLAELGVASFAAGAVPKDVPGLLTVAANDPGAAEAQKSIAEYVDPPDERYRQRQEAMSLEPLGPTQPRRTERFGKLGRG
jgi:hypothetical protein